MRDELSLIKTTRNMDEAAWEALFRRMYCIVCSRCYGYYLPYTFLAPVLDMFNHDDNYDSGLLLLNKELHLNPLKSRSYFKSNKYLSDARMLYQGDTEMDEKGRTDVLAKGFEPTDEYRK